MISLLLATALAAVPVDEAGWVDVPEQNPAHVETCAKLVKKAKRGLVWSQIGIGFAAGIAGRSSSYYSGSVRVGGETTSYSGSVSYTDYAKRQRVMDDLSAARGTGLSKKMQKLFAENNCDPQLYYTSR